MWPYASAATYYVTGFGREGAGHEFSEFLLPHWTLDDMLCLVSMTVYKIENTMDNKEKLFNDESIAMICSFSYTNLIV